jgi:hypothetical protein
MSQTQLKKLDAARLPDILARCALPPEAMTVIDPQRDTATATAALERAGFALEAARVFAHGLPKREAVWWACMCALYTAPEDLAGPDRLAREAAEQWVRSQEDEIRRTAMDHARAAGMRAPEAWAGVAAYWSGNSITPLSAPAVPPPPHLTGVAVAGAVALSAVRQFPQRRPQRLALFLSSARDIAAGGPGRLPAERA